MEASPDPRTGPEDLVPPGVMCRLRFTRTVPALWGNGCEGVAAGGTTGASPVTCGAFRPVGGVGSGAASVGALAAPAGTPAMSAAPTTITAAMPLTTASLACRALAMDE